MPEQPALSEPVFSGDSRELAGTDVAAALSAPLNWKRNTIWAAAFETAWRKLETDVIGSPIRLDSAGVSSIALRAAGPLPEGTLPEDSLSAAHYVDAHNVDEIQTEINEAFVGYALDPPEIEPPSLLAYAVLKAWVPFTFPYLEFDYPLHFWTSKNRCTPVQSFGIYDKDDDTIDKLRAQARLLYAEYVEAEYATHAHDFIVDLCADSSPCQVVVARIAPGETLKATLEDAEAKILKQQSQARSFKETETLRIPEIAFSVVHKFIDLMNARCLHTRFPVAIIKAAVEAIRFQLDKNGAYVASAAYVYECLDAPSRETRYIADRPFLVYARNRVAQHPFFVMWVGNDELIRKW